MIDIEELADAIKNRRPCMLRHVSGFQIPSRFVVAFEMENAATCATLGGPRPIPRYVYTLEYCVPDQRDRYPHKMHMDPDWEIVFPDEQEQKDEGCMTPEEHIEQKPVHDAAVRSALKHLAQQEADFATQRYGYYHSPHEGLALIDEEVHEANHAQTLLGNHMHWLRNTVFNDLGERQMDAIKEIRDHALHLAQEAIHVAATAQRFAEAYETGEGEWAELSK